MIIIISKNNLKCTFIFLLTHKCNLSEGIDNKLSFMLLCFIFFLHVFICIHCLNFKRFHIFLAFQISDLSSIARKGKFAYVLQTSKWILGT